jgi:transposase-like protein
MTGSQVRVLFAAPAQLDLASLNSGKKHAGAANEVRHQNGRRARQNEMVRVQYGWTNRSLYVLLAPEARLFMRPGQNEKCSIEHVGKQRNGKPRYWCKAHQCSATGPHGARLQVCVGASKITKRPKVLELDAQAHPGGIALWGAVEAVYDTSSVPPEIGIHVHARANKDGQKEVDDTFDTVVVKLSSTEQATISGDTAISFYMSRFLNREIKLLRCPHCEEVHLDAGYFAVKPHRKHMCQACGRHFNDSEKSISNPVALLQVVQHNVAPIRAPRRLNIEQASFPGGMQIWASNPALVWTSDRPEEAGLHIHLYDSQGIISVDDTFDHVVIDGIELNEAHVRYFMAQQALPHLSNKIVNLTCPRCKTPHFDTDDLAFFPHSEHTCGHCGRKFISNGRRKLVVSNPFASVRTSLLARRQSNQN